MNKKIKIILTIIILLVLILILALIGFNKENIVKKLKYISMKQLDKGIYYHIYNYNYNTKKGDMLLKFVEPINGIDTITCPDGTIIKGYGKKQISIDYSIENNDSKYLFTVITQSGEEIKKEITINQNVIDELIQFTLKEEFTNLTFNINYNTYKNMYYKFDENGSWQIYNGEFSILAEEVVKQGGYNELNKTSKIYLKGSDDLENEVIIEKEVPIIAQMPKVELVFRNKQDDVNIEQLKTNIKQELAKSNISAGLMDISIGGEETVQSNGENAEVIFNTWGRVGYKGQWYYDASTQTIINAENTNDYTGFYYPKTSNYNEIELKYDNTSTDGDDDMMGAMIRFNKNSNGTVTTYLFALDKNDMNGGISYSGFNGLLKIEGKNFNHANVKVLQRINRTWTRNTWTNYRLVAKNNNIKVYMDNELVIDYTDNSNPILTGTYGFFSYSQADSRYKNIIGKGLRYYTLDESINGTVWDKDSSFIINVNYGEEKFTPELANSMSEKEIYYIGVTLPEQQTATENFISLNNNKGKYINAQDEKYVTNIVEYIKTIIKE